MGSAPLGRFICVEASDYPDALSPSIPAHIRLGKAVFFSQTAQPSMPFHRKDSVVVCAARGHFDLLIGRDRQVTNHPNYVPDTQARTGISSAPLVLSAAVAPSAYQCGHIKSKGQGKVRILQTAGLASRRAGGIRRPRPERGTHLHPSRISDFHLMRRAPPSRLVPSQKPLDRSRKAFGS